MLLNLTLIFIIVAAIIAVEANLNIGIFALAFMGAGMSIAFLMFGSYEAAILIFTLEVPILLMLIKTISKDVGEEKYGKSDILSALITLVSIAVILFASSKALVNVHIFGLALTRTDITPGGFYELLSVVAIFTAVIGTLAITRDTDDKH
jgi:hypothetical protein